MAGQLDLPGFLKVSAGLGFVWGERDCALWVCEWIHHMRGVDPGQAYYGRYSTEIGCGKLLKRRGGLLAVADEAFELVGLRKTEDPKIGDVALVRVDDIEPLAIRAKTGWAFFGPQGVVIRSDVVLVQGWSVQCHQS